MKKTKQPGTLRASWPAEVRALTRSGAFLSPAGQKFVESHRVEVEQLPIGAGQVAELLWPLAPKGEPQCLWMVNTGEGVRRGFTGNRAWAKRRMAAVRAELGLAPHAIGRPSANSSTLKRSNP